MAIEPRSVPDQEKMGVALEKLAQEDPSFQVKTTRSRGKPSFPAWASSTSTSSSIVCAASSSVEAKVGKPQVAYRETIRNTFEQEGKFVRQSGGKGQYGHVWVETRAAWTLIAEQPSRTR